MLNALTRIHAASWDDAVGMVRLLPGTDDSAERRGRHPVRETALGAYLDLSRGETERARRAIVSVLSHQYATGGLPWSGTFKVTAEDDAPSRNVLRSYDANWRQFIGVTLALCLEDFPDELGEEMSADILTAASAAIHGEPSGRIPPWYTNPALMHVWLCDWIGQRAGDLSAAQAADSIAAEQLARLRGNGDVDEYNSPTYDGVNLMAAALMVEFSTSPLVVELGQAVLEAVGSRLAMLYAPRLGAICGPYLRAYGMDLTQYVSLAGLWLALLGAPNTLPGRLNESTSHIHDLYFAPVFGRLLAAVAPSIPLDQPTNLRHEHHAGVVTSVSARNAVFACGAEAGRLPSFARDQYLPWTIHSRPAGQSTTAWTGMKLGDDTERIDAILLRDGTATITVHASPGSSATCRLVVSDDLQPTRDGFQTSSARLVLKQPLAAVSAEPVEVGRQYLLEFHEATAVIVAEPALCRPQPQPPSETVVDQDKETAR